jgi:hypothetical protein
MVKAVLRLLGEEYRYVSQGPSFRFADGNHGEIGPGMILRHGDSQLGWLFLLALPGQRTLLRVPPGRGSTNPASSWGDPTGDQFAVFLNYALPILAEYGFSARRTKFKSDEMVHHANRSLDAADTPEGHAAVGTPCRQALIALANELFRPEMVVQSEAAPSGDDARGKLKIVVRHYWGTRAENQRDAIMKLVEGAWDQTSALRYRKTATREEAEACVVATTAVFDTMALILP